MVVDNTFSTVIISITLPARFLVKFLQIMSFVLLPFQFGLVIPCLGLIKGYDVV